MTIAVWLLAGILPVNLGLMIFANIKKHLALQKLCVCLTLPISGSLIILLLSAYLPDSYHIMFISTIALSLVSLSTAFLAFEKFRTLRISGRIASLGNVFCWIILYRSIFKIYSVPVWLYILAACIYAAIIISACVFSGKQEPRFYGAFALSFLLAAYLNFCSLIFLCREKNSSSIMLFAGTTLYAVLVTFHFLNTTKLKIKHAGGLRFNMMFISQVLIACSNILMIR